MHGCDGHSHYGFITTRIAILRLKSYISNPSWRETSSSLNDKISRDDQTSRVHPYKKKKELCQYFPPFRHMEEGTRTVAHASHMRAVSFLASCRNLTKAKLISETSGLGWLSEACLTITAVWHRMRRLRQFEHRSFFLSSRSLSFYLSLPCN